MKALELLTRSILISLFVLVAPVGASEFAYSYRGERIELEVDSTSIFVDARFAVDGVEHDIVNVIPGTRGVLTVGERLSVGDLVACTRALHAVPSITSSAPVLRRGYSRVVPKSEVLLVLERGVAPRELADLTIVREYPGLTPILLVAVDGAPIDVFAHCDRLAARSEIRSASPNLIHLDRKASRPNDALYPLQWYLENLGQTGGTPGADVAGLHALNMSIDASAVTVAVLDEGVDVDHPELSASVVAGYDATDQPSPAGVPGNADDGDPHGTLCAGLAIAAANDGVGIAGLVPTAQLLPIRMGYGFYWTETAWVIDAITWATDNGADVLSCSWGGSAPNVAEETAIEYARTVGRGGLGCAVVFATQNFDTDVAYPAAYDNTIAVGASSPCDERCSPTSCDGETWWGSNYGPEVTVVAPGVDIATTDLAGAVGMSFEDSVEGWRGTSASTPLVAGAIALLLAVAPDLSIAEVEARLIATAADQVGPATEDTPGFDSFMGWGRLDVAALIATAWPGLSLTGGNTRVAPGQTFSQTVRLRSDVAVEAITYGVQVDPTVVTITDIDVGSALVVADYLAAQFDPVVGYYTIDAVYPPSALLAPGGDHWLASAIASIAAPASTPVGFTFTPAVGPDELPTLVVGGGEERVPNLVAGVVAIDPTTEDFLRGDADANGQVTIGDALATLEHLFLGGTVDCPDGADFDDSGTVDVVDAFAFLAYLFQGGPIPADPYPLPSADPTDDGLGC